MWSELQQFSIIIIIAEEVNTCSDDVHHAKFNLIFVEYE